MREKTLRLRGQERPVVGCVQMAEGLKPAIFPTLELLQIINSRMPRQYTIEGTVQVNVREEEVKALHQVGRDWDIWWSCPVVTEMGRDGVIAIKLSTELAKSGFMGLGLNYPRVKVLKRIYPEEEANTDEDMEANDTLVPGSDGSDDQDSSPSLLKGGQVGQEPDQALAGPSSQGGFQLQRGSEVGTSTGAGRPRPVLSLRPMPEVITVSSSSDSPDSSPTMSASQKK